MTTFTVRHSATHPVSFMLSGPDASLTTAVNAFLADLSQRGRSAYTLRAYALGLADFCAWLHAAGLPLDAVTRQTIDAYLMDFASGVKGGACPVDPARTDRVNLLTRKTGPATHRQPRTVNHRLSVLASFFAALIRRDTEAGGGQWRGRANPVPSAADPSRGRHGMPGRDAPPRGRRGELRRRVPHRVPTALAPEVVEHLIAAAGSWRDKALLTLLARTGQRIGDWSAIAGRHGILGMTLADVDARTQTVTVRLKGARDAHRVPVTEDFWPLWHRYLAEERRAEPACSAAWVGLRKGRGHPLTYAAFESALRYTGKKIGANVHAHLFRHTLAQALVETGGLKVAQEMLGHRHLSTTADTYARVDEAALVTAVAAAWRQRHAVSASTGENAPPRYVFPYDAVTVRELEAVAHPDECAGGNANGQY